MKHKIILDCDPGHDDAIAILLAGHHPEIELLAITTVAGNQSVDKTTLNALKVCSLAGLRSIPVARGMDRPLVLPAQHAADIHGESGLDGPDLPEPNMEPVNIHAVDLIIELLLQSAGDITLFNIYVDPHAAAIVFDCGRPITMCPLEVTHQALATERVLHRLRSANQPVATVTADLLDFFAETYRKVFSFPAAPVHDPCAVAAIIDPTLIKSKPVRVEIETAGEWTRGRTACDMYGSLGGEPNANVGYGLDAERFWDMLIETILSYKN